MAEDENKPDPKPDETPKTFTQAELDKAIGDRLARERTKYADYDDLKAKASKFDELDAATKSEAQKSADRVTAAERRAADAEAKAMRLEIATAKGLSAAHAKRLVGTTKEELEADADEILETFKPADGKTPAGDLQRKPSEDLRSGGDPTTEPAPDVRKIVADIPRGGM